MKACKEVDWRSVRAGRNAWGPRRVPASGSEPRRKRPGTPQQVNIIFHLCTRRCDRARGKSTVQWVNRDDIPHTVVSDDKTTFKSKALDTDDNFSYTFSKPGTYSYISALFIQK